MAAPLSQQDRIDALNRARDAFFNEKELLDDKPGSRYHKLVADEGESLVAAAAGHVRQGELRTKLQAQDFGAVADIVNVVLRDWAAA